MAGDAPSGSQPSPTPWEFNRSKLKLVSVLGEGNFGVVSSEYLNMFYYAPFSFINYSLRSVVYLICNKKKLWRGEFRIFKHLFYLGPFNLIKSFFTKFCVFNCNKNI